MLSYLSSLPISVLHSLDTEVNKFYDRSNRLYDAALLTKCYTQHAVRPVIDSKINHVRHFIKIHFINKEMEFIDSPSTFRDKSVQSAVPTLTSQPVHFSLPFQLRADLKLSNSCYCSRLLSFHRANRCSIMAQKP